MTLHFENIWEAAEVQSSKSDTTVASSIDNIKKQLDTYSKLCNSSDIDPSLLFKLKSKKIGEILFMISNIYKLETLNVAACLHNATQDSKLKEIENENEEDIY